MSRSTKKSKIKGISSATSEKKDKQIANRKFRRTVKQKVNLGNDEIPDLKEITNKFSFDKDGKIYDSEMSERDLRK